MVSEFSVVYFLSIIFQIKWSAHPSLQAFWLLGWELILLAERVCNVPGILVDSQNHESHKIQSELEDGGLAEWYSTHVHTSMIKHLSSFFEVCIL